jgi:hypothetical protein
MLGRLHDDIRAGFDWLAALLGRRQSCEPLQPLLRHDGDDVRQREAVMRPGPTLDTDLRWSRLSEQNLRIDKWSVCQG